MKSSTWRIALWTLLAVAVGWGLTRWLREPAGQPRAPVTRAERGWVEQSAEPGEWTNDAAVPPPPPPPAKVAAPAGDDLRCVAHAEQHCFQGDLWWYDSCGDREDRIECGEYGCEQDQCVAAPTQACSEPLVGRCQNDRVHVCVRGRDVRIDCAARGMRCVRGAEGAQCAKVPTDAVECTPEPDRCEGAELVRCVEGFERRVDCAARGAVCADDGARAGCLRVLRSSQGPLLSSEPDCGACGCEPQPEVPERCNGVDDNLDGLVDEGVDCGTLPILAFIVRGGNHSEADVRLDIQRVQQALANSPGGRNLKVELSEVIELSDSSLRRVDSDRFYQLARDATLHPARAEFHVPVLYVDELTIGGTPKLGVSTLPNATCGGIQEGWDDGVGLIAVAKGAHITTTAHELGHFLGLCHTHDQRVADAVAAAQDGASEAESCEAECDLSGDGVCDTPPDPGVEQCNITRCLTQCGGGEQPDASNLMSYYHPCRQRFSRDQVRLMQHSLALRRAWHGCAGGCPCSLGQRDCPAGMACRPTQRGFQCLQEGPLGAGAVCDPQQGQYCDRQTVCVADRAGSAHCARLCDQSVRDCQCVPLPSAEDVGVCRQDL